MPEGGDEVFRGPSVLDRWCVAFDSFAVRSPNGAWVLGMVD